MKAPRLQRHFIFRVLLLLMLADRSVLKAGPPPAGLVPGMKGTASSSSVCGEPFPVRQFSATRYRLREIDARMNYRLACVAARMRRYPLAMRLFLHSLRRRPARHNAAIRTTDTTDYDTTDYFMQAGEQGLQTVQTIILGTKSAAVSPRISPVTYPDSIMAVLTDTTDAVRYAIIIQVKQPEHGKRRIFTGLGNVGHSFITLIRYRRNQSAVAFSFGLYPKKNYPLAGSPFFPHTPPIFRDDSEHDWDEMVGRFISAKQFGAVCRAALTYCQKRYDLNKNNCTDFALAMAEMTGIGFSETKGRWPFGHGNNPACLGQSIFAGNFRDRVAGSKEDLFVDINHENNF